MSEDHKKICNFCDKTFERNNFYFGKLMKAQDFETEQSYFNEKRWLINRMVHGWGVVCGLDVNPLEDESNKLTKVSIEPGLAIDCHGREIIVCKRKEVSLKPEETECSNNDNTHQTGKQEKYAICLKFKDCKTEYFPVMYGTCDQKEKCQSNRIKDWFEVIVVPFSKLNKENHRQDKKEHFCPKKYSCPDKEDSQKNPQKKSLHECICDWLINCPECCDHSCIVLATIALDENSEIKNIDKDIDKCSERKLIYNNPLLYDLISCYHGDLPRVCKINWKHDEKLRWHDFETIVDDGLEVTFNKIMRHDSINKHTFRVSAITVGEIGGYRLVKYIPAEGKKIDVEDVEEEIGNASVKVTKATFHFEQGWKNDEVRTKEGHPAVHSEIAHGVEFEITLRGSSIFSEDGKALDGSFKGNLCHEYDANLHYDKGINSHLDKKANLPSGVGTQGTDFISWFSVHPRHRPARDTYEENQSVEEEENEY